ncbi:MAG TPA: alpha-amylase family glycosyl hydrolase [Bryobacteraceae bacterium]|nr:alpha-amylase family glycosyl hydrolase [Bryobacteraceae bacterium]
MTARLGSVVAAVCVLPACPQALASNDFVYHVFVRSFADAASDRGANGQIGDLRGLRENLDYINDGRPGKGSDLEAGILWLMPIFPTGTYHGYDIEDYRAVNPEYGTLQDLRDLVQEAHRRGVRVILDIAFNHTSNRHPWFLEAVKNPASRYRKFYVMEPAEGQARSRRWRAVGSLRYFAPFSDRMPELNLDDPAVRTEVKAIAKFWLDQGIDGFRLDAAKHAFDDGEGEFTEEEVRKNNDWWREFCDFVYSVKADAVLVGEVLGRPDMLRRHARGFDALLDDPFLDAAREYIAAPRPGLLRAWLDWVRGYRQANGRGRFEPWVFLGSHDRTPRLASFLEQRAAGRVEEAYRLGMYLLFSVARFPVMYSGDELMQRGVKWPNDGSRVYDETLREPFPWFASGTSKPPQTGWFAPRYDKPNDGVSVEEQGRRGGMLDLVRRLSRLRVQYPEFATGDIDAVLADDAEWLVFTKGRYLVQIRAMGVGSAYRLPQAWRKARVVFRSDDSRFVVMERSPL